MSAPDLSEYAIAVRVFMALSFVIAAGGKLRHRQTFQGVVANYRLLPQFLIVPVAALLPFAELLVGVGLLTGVPLWPAVMACALLAAFAIGMAANLLRGRDHVDCGCFDSTLAQTLRWSLVARNVVMIAMLAAALPMLSETSNPASVWAWVEGGLAGAAAFIILQSVNALWALKPMALRAHRH